MQEKIVVKEDDPQTKRVVKPNGETAIADVLGVFEIGGNNYLICWFPLAQYDASKAIAFRFEEVNGFIRLFVIETNEEYDAVLALFKNTNTD